MKFLKLAKRNKEVDPGSWEAFYGSKVVERIRTRYSVDQELAILRQRETKPDEFAEFNAFVEKCKADVKAELNI